MDYPNPRVDQCRRRRRIFYNVPRASDLYWAWRSCSSLALSMKTKKLCLISQVKYEVPVRPTEDDWGSVPLERTPAYWNERTRSHDSAACGYRRADELDESHRIALRKRSAGRVLWFGRKYSPRRLPMMDSTTRYGAVDLTVHEKNASAQLPSESESMISPLINLLQSKISESHHFGAITSFAVRELDVSGCPSMLQWSYIYC